MDPISLAAATSAVTVLGTDVIKGAASSAGKDLWEKVKNLLTINVDPAVADVPIVVASRLENDEDLLRQLVQLLKASNSSESFAGALVGRLDSDKAVVVQNMVVKGDFNM